MKTIALLFSTTANPMSAVIRAFTFSRWSHVAIIDGDTVIEAAALHGVRRVPVLDAINRAKRGEVVEFPCQDPDRIIAAAASQIGKPYDYTALIGLGLRRDWQESDSWFCSELVAWAFQEAGEPIFRADAMHRVTPEHLWMLDPSDRFQIQATRNL